MLHHLTIPERIETERLVLQRLRYEDAEQIFYTYASKPEVTRYLTWPTHITIEDTRSFLRYAIDSWNKGTDYSFGLRLKSSNQLIGSFGLIHDHGKIQFGYAVSPSQWKKGYTTEACKKMMSLLINHHGLYRVGTFVDADNIASIRVLQKSGLVEEARLKKWFRFVNQDNQPKDCLLFYLPLENRSEIRL
jgi:[ribosomal protein S5]-alanine N-acetyltransferase